VLYSLFPYTTLFRSWRDHPLRCVETVRLVVVPKNAPAVGLVVVDTTRRTYSPSETEIVSRVLASPILGCSIFLPNSVRNPSPAQIGSAHVSTTVTPA